MQSAEGVSHLPSMLSFVRWHTQTCWKWGGHTPGGGGGDCERVAYRYHLTQPHCAKRGVYLWFVRDFNLVKRIMTMKVPFIVGLLESWAWLERSSFFTQSVSRDGNLLALAGIFAFWGTILEIRQNSLRNSVCVYDLRIELLTSQARVAIRYTISSWIGVSIFGLKLDRLVIHRVLPKR